MRERGTARGRCKSRARALRPHPARPSRVGDPDIAVAVRPAVVRRVFSSPRSRRAMLARCRSVTSAAPPMRQRDERAGRLAAQRKRERKRPHAQQRSQRRQPRRRVDDDVRAEADQRRDRRQRQRDAQRRRDPLAAAPAQEQREHVADDRRAAGGGDDLGRHVEVAPEPRRARIPWRRRPAARRSPSPCPARAPTLVAPMLPLPTWRRSTPLARATTTPNGIEPMT